MTAAEEQEQIVTVLSVRQPAWATRCAGVCPGFILGVFG